MFDILDLESGSRGKLACNSSFADVQEETKESFEYKSLCYGVQNNILELEKSSDEDIKSINFGTAMHYMLEMIADFKDIDVSYAYDMMINRYGVLLEDSEVEDINIRVKMLLADKEFQELCDGDCYREKAIRYKNNLRYIDLLVKKDDVWNVIDYKSSYAFSDSHKTQVNYYVNAIKEITSQKVEGYICYLLTDKIVYVKVC